MFASMFTCGYNGEPYTALNVYLQILHESWAELNFISGRSHVVTMASFNTNKGDIVVCIFSHSNYTTILPEICRSEPDNCYGFV